MKFMACINWNRRHLRDVSGLQISDEITKRELITELHLCFNFIVAVPPDSFHGFSNLAYLSLNCNNLTLVPPLVATPALKELHLANNQISTIDNLEYVPCLRCLNLCCNRIQCISNLTRNAQLQELHLSGNLLTSIDWDTFPDFQHLSTLGLYSNLFTDFKSMLKLISTMPRLTRMHLGCNPFSDGQPLTLGSAFLNMWHLDQSQVTQFVMQLKPCISSLDFMILNEDVPTALKELCGEYVLQDPQNLQRLVQVLQMLGCLKLTCPSLVSVDGDPLFSAVFVQSERDSTQ